MVLNIACKFDEASYNIYLVRNLSTHFGGSGVTKRNPFGRDNSKNILDLSNLVCGYIWAMPRTLLFCDLDLQFQGH